MAGEKLIDLMGRAASDAIAEKILGDDEARKAIIADAVAHVLKLDEKVVQSTLESAAKNAMKQAVDELIKVEMEKPEVVERIKERIRGHLDEVVDKIAVSAGRMVEKAFVAVINASPRY